MTDDLKARGVPQLLPCPFCGKNAKLVCGGPGNYFAQCQWCMASAGDGSKERAVEKWNRRAAISDHPAVKALVAEAEARGMERAAQICTDAEDTIFGKSMDLRTAAITIRAEAAAIRSAGDAK